MALLASSEVTYLTKQHPAQKRLVEMKYEITLWTSSMQDMHGGHNQNKEYI